mgnify:CR=1 FL=1
MSYQVFPKYKGDPVILVYRLASDDGKVQLSSKELILPADTWFTYDWMMEKLYNFIEKIVKPSGYYKVGECILLYRKFSDREVADYGYIDTAFEVWAIKEDGLEQL